MDKIKLSLLHDWEKENEAVLDEMGIDCKKSKVGKHECSVKTRYGWCCDVCLENELMWLYSHGIHTINSCCGHGNRGLSSILVIGEESKKNMEALGYVLAEIHVRDSNMTAYTPKTTLPYDRSGQSMEKDGAGNG